MLTNIYGHVQLLETTGIMQRESSVAFLAKVKSIVKLSNSIITIINVNHSVNDGLWNDVETNVKQRQPPIFFSSGSKPRKSFRFGDIDVSDGILISYDDITMKISIVDGHPRCASSSVNLQFFNRRSIEIHVTLGDLRHERRVNDAQRWRFSIDGESNYVVRDSTW